jgi:hypothetical protein
MGIGAAVADKFVGTVLEYDSGRSCHQQSKMEILNMKRAMKILSLVSLTSVYVTAGTCVMSGDGWSFLPTIPLPGFLTGIVGT